MKRLGLMPTVALVAALATGCGSDDPTTAPTVSDPAGDELLVEYVRGGGFAPSLQRLTIQADGDAVLVSGYEPEAPERQDVVIRADQLEELKEAVAAADLDAVEKGSSVCADCFEYELRTTEGEVELSEADLFDGTDSAVPIEVVDLLDRLGEIVEENQRETPMIGG
jgi:hypothetical protein